MGVILLLLGLALYSFAVANQYISTAYTLSRSAAEVLHESSEVEKLSVEVIGRYRALSAEERAEVDTDEYEERFDDIPEGGI